MFSGCNRALREHWALRKKRRYQNYVCNLGSADGNGPKWAFDFAQSDQCECAEGRTGQWECIKEKTIYRTSTCFKNPSVPELVSLLPSFVFFCYLVSSIMLFQALLQTSLVLWMARQTLQGGKKNVGFYGLIMKRQNTGCVLKQYTDLRSVQFLSNLRLYI